MRVKLIRLNNRSVLRVYRESEFDSTNVCVNVKSKQSGALCEILAKLIRKNALNARAAIELEI